MSLTPEEFKVGRRTLVRDLREMLARDLDETPIDAQMMRDLVEVLEAAESSKAAAVAPAEPAGVSGEAVEAALEVLFDHGHTGIQCYDPKPGLDLTVRAALEAAYPFMGDAEVRAKAWDEGHQAGWTHHQDGNFGNDYWDDSTSNPHRPTGVNSTLYTCTGCGVKVIGHERCGDPTRAECAK